MHASRAFCSFGSGRLAQESVCRPRDRSSRRLSASDVPCSGCAPLLPALRRRERVCALKRLAEGTLRAGSGLAFSLLEPIRPKWQRYRAFGLASHRGLCRCRHSPRWAARFSHRVTRTRIPEHGQVLPQLIMECSDRNTNRSLHRAKRRV
jgi:hypothetical protein